MRRSGNNYEPFFAAELPERRPVQLDYCEIIPTDDEQRWCPGARQSRPGQIGTTASRDNRAHCLRPLGSRHQSGASPGAGAEVADSKAARVLVLCEPVRRSHEALGEQIDVETQVSRPHIARLLVRREEIDQQGR